MERIGDRLKSGTARERLECLLWALGDGKYELESRGTTRKYRTLVRGGKRRLWLEWDTARVSGRLWQDGMRRKWFCLALAKILGPAVADEGK